MLSYILLLAAFAAVGAIFCCICYGWAADNGGFGAFIGVLVGLLPAFLICWLVIGEAPIEQQYARELIAMKDNTSVSGSFFLGTGRVESNLCYVYLVETDLGITQKVVTPSSTCSVYIRYTDGQPYVEYYASSDELWRMASDFSYYIFYLPEGSIIGEVYAIDLE